MAAKAAAEPGQGEPRPWRLVQRDGSRRSADPEIARQVAGLEQLAAVRLAAARRSIAMPFARPQVADLLADATVPGPNQSSALARPPADLPACGAGADPVLERLLALWPTLRSATRAAILAMAQSG